MSSIVLPPLDLEGLPLSELRARWQGYFGMQAPANMSQQLLRLAIAYKMQEEAQGGLSKSARLRLKSLSSRSRSSAVELRLVGVTKSGTRFIREWQGQAHEVLALDNGMFAYDGKTYRSLTTIAKQITGTHQSGPRFFGMPPTKEADHGRAP